MRDFVDVDVDLFRKVTRDGLAMARESVWEGDTG
jgi:hypothetical protein